MIAGVVNANREAVIQLVVRGSNGQEQAIQAIIDTGFTGFLTLPLALIDSLGLPLSQSAFHISPLSIFETRFRNGQLRFCIGVG